MGWYNLLCVYIIIPFRFLLLYEQWFYTNKVLIHPFGELNFNYNFPIEFISLLMFPHCNSWYLDRKNIDIDFRPFRFSDNFPKNFTTMDPVMDKNLGKINHTCHRVFFFFDSFKKIVLKFERILRVFYNFIWKIINIIAFTIR